MLIACLSLGGVLGLCWASPVYAAPDATETTTEETPEQKRERLLAEREQRRIADLAQREGKRLEVEKLYDQMGQLYMQNKMDQVQALGKQIRLQQGVLSREQQDNIRHMTQAAAEYPPKWWAGTGKQDKNSFQAEIWGRKFWANYVPSSELGVQFIEPEYGWNRRTNEYEIVKINIFVTWKPLMVNSPDPAKGRLAVENGYTLGDIAETIVWHELGHNYITEQVTLAANIELYTNYANLYSTIHEYYADMTALAHASPKARRIMLQFRLDGLDYYTGDESHCRASHGVGSLVIVDMLENPDKWPSVHFPPKVPEKQIELNTMIYIYENLETTWTMEEDVRLQKLVQDYMKKNGETTFKRKGEVQLPNGLKMKLMIGEDQENQEQRDTWVYDKLNKLIESGRADDIKVVGKYEPPLRDHKRERNLAIHLTTEADKKDQADEPKRIEVPWEH